jgi:hypothetical protein
METDYCQNIYFETSAVNFLFRDFGVIDAIATRSLQEAKGNRWYLSPVTLWEIMLIGDEEHKEKLFSLSKHTFYKYLLKSPSEILFGFIHGDFKSKTRSNIHSTSILAKTWTGICENPSLTFGTNPVKFMEASGKFKKYAKQIDSIVNSIYFDSEITDEVKWLNLMVNTAFKAIYNLKFVDSEQTKILKINLLLILVTGCLGIDATPDVVHAFWKEKKITSVYRRFLYLVTHFPILLQDGPLIYSSIMVYAQMKSKKSRGVIHDALHCMYLPMIDGFLTCDHDFKDFSIMGYGGNHSKIRILHESSFIRKKVWVDYEQLLKE